MGYADIDKLAINTIRVLAVSSTPPSLLNYPSILAIFLVLDYCLPTTITDKHI
jgi:hypothetical protein